MPHLSFENILQKPVLKSTLNIKRQDISHLDTSSVYQGFNVGHSKIFYLRCKTQNSRIEYMLAFFDMEPIQFNSIQWFIISK